MNGNGDNKKVNILCWISLACLIVPFILTPVLRELVTVADDTVVASVFRFLDSFLGVLSGIGHILGLVIMIYVRIKYPKNVFGKVVMWLYIIAIVLVVLFIILLMVLCNGCMDGMSGCCQEIRKIDS